MIQLMGIISGQTCNVGAGEGITGRALSEAICLHQLLHIILPVST